MVQTFGPAYFDQYKVEGYTPDDFEIEALSTINEEKESWDNREVFITDKVSYVMKNVIEQARKYYMGVFDSPHDEVTGEDKIWVPITETAVEQVRKSIDLDTKDILIEPARKSAVNIAPLIRALIQNLFVKINFGALLNEISTTIARDGTVVVKSLIDVNPHTGKEEIRSYIVNLLNLWCDPHARSLQETAVIERSLISEFDAESHKDGWDNVDKISFSTETPSLEDLYDASTTGKLPYAEIYERWGMIKKSWITKKSADNDTWVEGHIVSSGMSGAQVLHLIRENPREDGRKPYEEAWFRKIDNRWFGRGIPEMLFGLQEYANIIVNTRKMNNLVLQNGIFLIRRGSPVTPDMLSSITAGGGIQVGDIDRDIKQLPVNDYRASSYVDEDRVNIMADRVSGAFDITRGEVGKASASATATLERSRNIRDTFVIIQEDIGFFIGRLIEKQYIPMMKEVMNTDDIIKVTGDADALSFIDNAIVESRKNNYIKLQQAKTGFRPEQIKIDEFVQSQLEDLGKMGKRRFITYFKEIFDEEVDIEVHITDEKFDRIVAVQQLRDALIVYSRLPVASKLDTDAILREMFNIMGIKGQFFMEGPQLPNLAPGLAQTGRQLKELPEQPPTPIGASQAAQGAQRRQPVATPNCKQQFRVSAGLSCLQ